MNKYVKIDIKIKSGLIALAYLQIFEKGDNTQYSPHYRRMEENGSP